MVSQFFPAPVVCNAGGQMTFDMPRATMTGATWMYWYPQIFANPYRFISGAGGSLMWAGATLARNLTTNQVYALNPNGTWRGPYSGNVSLVYKAAASDRYAVDDWVQFVAADGSALAGGWFNNGYRLDIVYSGPNRQPNDGFAYATGACSY
jgi:hypothetical protein